MADAAGTAPDDNVFGLALLTFTAPATDEPSAQDSVPADSADEAARQNGLPDAWRHDFLCRFTDAESRLAVFQTCRASRDWLLRDAPQVTVTVTKGNEPHLDSTRALLSQHRSTGRTSLLAPTKADLMTAARTLYSTPGITSVSVRLSSWSERATSQLATHSLSAITTYDLETLIAYIDPASALRSLTLDVRLTDAVLAVLLTAPCITHVCVAGVGLTDAACAQRRCGWVEVSVRGALTAESLVCLPMPQDGSTLGLRFVGEEARFRVTMAQPQRASGWHAKALQRMCMYEPFDLHTLEMCTEGVGSDAAGGYETLSNALELIHAWGIKPLPDIHLTPPLPLSHLPHLASLPHWPTETDITGFTWVTPYGPPDITLSHLARLVSLTISHTLDDALLARLLNYGLNHLKDVTVDGLDLGSEGQRDRACVWETLRVKEASVLSLARLPLGGRRRHVSVSGSVSESEGVSHGVIMSGGVSRGDSVSGGVSHGVIMSGGVSGSVSESGGVSGGEDVSEMGPLEVTVDTLTLDLSHEHIASGAADGVLTRLSLIKLVSAHTVSTSVYPHTPTPLHGVILHANLQLLRALHPQEPARTVRLVRHTLTPETLAQLPHLPAWEARLEFVSVRWLEQPRQLYRDFARFLPVSYREWRVVGAWPHDHMIDVFRGLCAERNVQNPLSVLLSATCHKDEDVIAYIKQQYLSGSAKCYLSIGSLSE